MRRLTPMALAACVTALALPASAAGHAADAPTLKSKVQSPDIALNRLQQAKGRLTPLLRNLPDFASAQREAIPELDDRKLPGSFELVGHSPLRNRGMNSALAVHDGYAYIGSRSDSTHADSGILVVDVHEPKAPAVVREMAAPAAGESQRELRVLPGKDLLLVLGHGCNELIHRCANVANAGRSVAPSNIKVFDISGANAANPRLVGTYVPPRQTPQSPHEFFVWTDPDDPERVLVYGTTPSSDSGAQPQLYVTDFSRARRGIFSEVTTWRTRIGNPNRDNRLHSLTVSPDGRQAYLAYLGGGFLVADTSEIARDTRRPEISLITAVEDRVFWTDPGAHSAAKLPGQDFVMTTDEVYGELGGLLSAHGCPWGWPRFIDIENPAKPRIMSEFRLPGVNDTNACADVDPVRNNFASFASHNPTLTENIAFLTWHSAGLQAISTADPANPTGLAQFMPEPLPVVQTEDPALSSGMDKVVMWSFPVIVDGLIYVVDLRNGLYVLRYKGPFEDEVARVGFLDGNSNSGDVGRMEKGK